MIEEEEFFDRARAQACDTRPSIRSTFASPSGWRAAFSPYMSASNSMVRVMVLPTGVVKKKNTEKTMTANGSTARSADAANLPVIPHRARSKFDSPVQEGENDDDHDANHHKAFVGVVQHVVPHLVTHGGFDLGSVQRFSRLSLREMRSVPANPLTFALTRLDCREASNS